MLWDNAFIVIAFIILGLAACTLLMLIELQLSALNKKVEQIKIEVEEVRDGGKSAED